MIRLKVLVDKERNKVIFAESDDDFIDVLFSFLTLPIGTIIRRISDRPPTVGVDCMTNLYESIKNLDVQHFWTETCKTMLLHPRNSAAQCKRLKLQIDDRKPLTYFLCNNECALSKYKSLSLYPNAICECGSHMVNSMILSESGKSNLSSDARSRGAFVKGLTRFIVSDDLKVEPSSTVASLSLLSKLGHIDGSTIEDRNINIGVDEVLTLLKCSLVSKTPLTETLLKHNLVPDLGKEDFNHGSCTKCKMEGPESNLNSKIHVKLIVSKSKKIVCYAEATEDFVDLLSSFLTVPLGYIVKEMNSNISKGSINQLYNSVKELDVEKYLKSDEHKTMLLSPKLAPDFSYKNHLLSIEEDFHPSYFFSEWSNDSYNWSTYRLTSDSNFHIELHKRKRSSVLTVKDTKSHFKEITTRRGGFLTGPAMFTVTDDLIITPVSQISSLSLLTKLKVPFSDVEERVMQVGAEEAMRLLLASFVTKSALTNALLREPNPE